MNNRPCQIDCRMTERTRQRCHALGMPTICCDLEGAHPAACSICTNNDQSVAAALRTESAQARVRELARTWSGQELPEPMEFIPGLSAIPVQINGKRGRAGYVVALTREPDEQACINASHALADWVGVERNAFVSSVKRIAAHPATSLGTIAALLHWTQDDSTELADREGALDEFSDRLTESYEEITLLYKLSRLMTEVAAPGRFVEQACAELHATMSYGWVGAAFIADHAVARELAGRRIIHAGPNGAERSVRPVLATALERATAGALITIPSQDLARDAGVQASGDVALSRIISGDKFVGVIAAGEKRGGDTGVSSSDLKLLDAAAGSMGVFFENAALYDDQQAMFLGVLQTLTAAIDAKDRYTCGHSERVAHLAVRLAERVEMAADAVERLRISGLVHDIGKIGVPESVLSKPGRLTDAEFEQIKKHPEIGVRILRGLPQLSDVLPGVLHHHERWDGAGYPHRLAGEQIPLPARLLAVADAFDAMSSTRTYRAALPRTAVLEEIRRCAGAQFDPALAREFVRLDFAEYDRLVETHLKADPRSDGAREAAA